MAEANANPQIPPAVRKRIRKSFGSEQADKMELPNLLDIQLKSYTDFIHSEQVQTNNKIPDFMPPLLQYFLSKAFPEMLVLNMLAIVWESLPLM